MNEYYIQIEFSKHSLGNNNSPLPGMKEPDGILRFTRDPNGAVLFLPSWHRANMRQAAKILCKHHGEVEKIRWDPAVDGVVGSQLGVDYWFKRWYSAGSRRRYSKHESFVPGDLIGLSCAVPPAIEEEDLRRLMDLAGRYYGLSPFLPREYGFYKTVSIRPRRAVPPIEIENPKPTAQNSEAK